MNFFEDAIPDEIMGWHDYYQGIIAEKDEIIKQLEVQLGKQEGNPASTTGTDRQDGDKTGFDLGFTENKFNSRCSRCGGKQ